MPNDLMQQQHHIWNASVGRPLLATAANNARAIFETTATKHNPNVLSIELLVDWILDHDVGYKEGLLMCILINRSVFPLDMQQLQSDIEKQKVMINFQQKSWKI